MAHRPDRGFFHERKILRFMWRYILSWFPMVAIAIAIGMLRQARYGKHLGELQVHQVSTLIGIEFFGVYIGLVLRIWRPESAAQIIAIGSTWLAITIAFEFLFGHYVAGHSWDWLLDDYNLLAGRVWVFYWYGLR